MKKKMITALLASAMVLSLVACGGGGTDSNGGGDTSSSGSGTSSSSDSNKLTVWAWDQNFNIKAIETAAEQYKKDFSIRTIAKTHSVSYDTTKRRSFYVTSSSVLSRIHG